MIPCPTICIGIATYRRPLMLRRLLQSLQALTFSKVSEPGITIVVVDNDPSLSARPVIAEFLCKRYPLRYRVERRPGISFARNTALEMSRAADFVALVDDDEEVSPDWLDELLNAQAAFGADIVAGPVLPQFQVSPPQWMIDGHFFHRRRHLTGTRLTSVGAGNVLIASSVLHAFSPSWFDSRFARTGGEDTHFFRRCAALGYLVTWADDAVVYESVPPSRLSERYLISRARDGANQWTRVDLELCPTLRHLSSRFAAGVVRVLQGSTVSLLSPALPHQHRLRGQLLLAEGKGNLQAFFGHMHNAYGPLES